MNHAQIETRPRLHSLPMLHPHSTYFPRNLPASTFSPGHSNPLHYHPHPSNSPRSTVYHLVSIPLRCICADIQRLSPPALLTVQPRMVVGSLLHRTPKPALEIHFQRIPAPHYRTATPPSYWLPPARSLSQHTPPVPQFPILEFCSSAPEGVCEPVHANTWYRYTVH